MEGKRRLCRLQHARDSCGNPEHDTRTSQQNSGDAEHYKMAVELNSMGSEQNTRDFGHN